MRHARSGVLATAAASLAAVVAIFGPVAVSAAAPAGCTVEVSSVSAAGSQAASLPDGSTICLAAGSYGTLTLEAPRSGFVTVKPDPAASVTLADVDFPEGASHYALDGFHIAGDVTLERGGASFITVTSSTMKGFAAYWGSHDIDFEHNAVNGGGRTSEGIALISIDCSSPNAPTYSGCTTYPPVADVTIKGNELIGPFGDDGFNISHYDNVDIEDNEITKVIENGEHNDSLQSTFGGRNLVFRRNYVHDICGQGFFLKDGAVSNVVYDDNLIVRDGGCSRAPSGELALDVFDTHNLEITRNTFVDAGFGEELQNYESGGMESSGVVMNHNVMDDFSAAWQNPGGYHDNPKFVEDHNVLSSDGNWAGNGYQASTDSTQPPRFSDPAHDDYRAAPVTAGGSTYTAGVDWRPADFVYGPTGTAPPPPTPPTPTPTPTPTPRPTPPTTTTATPRAGSPATLLGDATPEPHGDWLPAGRAEAFRARANRDGTVTAVMVYIDGDSDSRTVVAGLYSDAGGHAGRRLSSGATARPHAGWNAIRLRRRVRLSSAARYWIALLGRRGILRFRDQVATGCRAETSAGGQAWLPRAWPAARRVADCTPSAYGVDDTAASSHARAANGSHARAPHAVRARTLSHEQSLVAGGG